MTVRRRLDPAVIRTRLEAGEFNIDLAAEYHVSPASISVAARKAGYEWKKLRSRHIKTGRANAKITIGQRDDIVKRVAVGETQKALAQEYGLSRARVSVIIKQYGSPLASPSPQAGAGASKVGLLPLDAPLSSCEV